MAEVGSEVWVRVNTPEAWVAGQIVERNEANVVVKLADSEETLTVPPVHEEGSTELQHVKLRNLDYSRFPTEKRGAVDDLIQLTYLHEPAILDVLSSRYANDCIYTSTGPILLAVNPFQKLPLYSKQDIEKQYLNGLLRSQGVDSGQLPPHVFGVADAAYRSMMDENARRTVDNRNQSLLVSGESGAGKTETTKFIMQYLATVGRPKSAKYDLHGEKDILATLPSVEKRVLDSNPILEAFGNAKTLRNENSSRFGKFICMQFNRMGELVGAKIETYLLEKVRLVTQGKGERNYHVFYQMCHGGSEAQRSSWGLKTAADYHFLNQSDCYKLREIDDTEEYTRMRSAMDSMGIATEDQNGLFDALAGVLHLSNFAFSDAAGGKAVLGGGSAAPGKSASSTAASTGQCKFADEAAETVAHACRLLGVDAADLCSALTTKEIVARSERYRTQFSLAQSCAATEALAKAVYGKLFLYLVHAINTQIRAPDTNVSSFIGVLDIFGFEHFEHNSFEQLCINYANETLQQQFNQFVFKLEQAEYEREGIEWSSITFPDNQDCLDLIEERKPPGLLALLDEQCMLASATDSQYANRLYKEFKDRPRFVATKKQQAVAQFAIRHYAGEVVYDTEGFIEKNKDEIHAEALQLMANSSSPMVRRFFAPTTAAEEATGGAGAKTGRGGLMSETVAKQFMGQLASLISVVRSTTPHYVRCIKPNSKQVPKEFERANVVSQLRCGGVLEAVRVARLGYPVRNPHIAFLSLYRVLVNSKDYDSMKKAAGGKGNEVSKLLIERLSALVPPKSVQIGLTKVFFRQDAFEILEAHRQKKLFASAVKLQASMKGFHEFRRYKHIRKFALRVQSLWRGHLARQLATSIRRANADIKRKAFVYRWICRARYLRFRHAVIALQSRKRGQEARAVFLQMRKEKIATQLQALYKAYSGRKRYVNYMKAWASIKRIYAAKKILKQLKDEKAFRLNNDALRSQNEELQAACASLRQQLDAALLQAANAAASSQHAAVVGESAEQTQLIVQLRQENTQLKQANDDLHSRIANMENEFSQWKQLLSAASAGSVRDITSLEGFLQAAKEHKLSAVDATTKASSSTGGAGGIHGGGEMSPRKSEISPRNMEPQLPEVTTLRARVAELDTQLADVTSKNTTLKQRLAAAEADAEKNRALVAVLSAAAAVESGGKTADSIVVPVTASASTTAEMNDIAAKREAASIASAQMHKQKVAGLERKLALAEKTVMDTSAARLRAEELAAQLKKENEEYKLQLSSIQKDSVSAYQKKLNELTVHAAGLEDRNKALQRQAEERLAELKRITDEKQQKEHVLNQRVNELFLELRDAKDLERAWKEKHDMNMEAMMNVARRLETLVVERAELQERIRMIEPQLEAIRRDNQALQESKSQMQHRAEEAERQRDIYREQNKQISLSAATIAQRTTPSPATSRRASITEHNTPPATDLKPPRPDSTPHTGPPSSGGAAPPGGGGGGAATTTTAGGNRGLLGSLWGGGRG